ncbi:unnamed protein product [Aureobasidium uvarum]|uniref:F-box domain-containing protein n=1 Tax=Aureobasidium uvarum TaxID=2773716 RepID=A0A9N8KPM3_9PEZI|nr:unnamed protein product [Aureobasidium uvarum]
MTTSVPKLPSPLETLPNEILYEIFSHVDEKDLSAVRDVCPRLCDIVTPRFALVNFTERIHVVSPHSIDALVGVTEHPVFGGYVKTVVICSGRRTTIPVTSTFPEQEYTEIPNQDTHLNDYVKTKRFAHRMERVFRNIRVHSGSVGIGIYDIPGKAETLEETVYAARRARCPITWLEVDLFADHPYFIQADLDAAMHRILESSLTPLNVYLCAGHSFRLAYGSDWQCLELEHFTFVNAIPLGPPLRAVYSWLLTRWVKHLRIFNVNGYHDFRLRPFLTPYLISLDLRMLSIWTGYFDRRLWSEQIRIISNLTGLQHCTISCLSYLFEFTADDDDDEGYLELPGYGRYPCVAPQFYLAFRDGTETIQMNGDDVCEQLKELASYVVAAEAYKVLEIVRDGRVNGLMVGVFDEFNLGLSLQSLQLDGAASAS